MVLLGVYIDLPMMKHKFLIKMQISEFLVSEVAVLYW